MIFLVRRVPTGRPKDQKYIENRSKTNTISISWHLIFDISPISELPTGHQTFSWYAKGMRKVCEKSGHRDLQLGARPPLVKAGGMGLPHRLERHNFF